MKNTGEWLSDDCLQFGEVTFNLRTKPEQYLTEKSSRNNFLLVKSRKMIEQEFRPVEEVGPMRNIVDIGIWQGGSVALLDQLYNPDLLVALEKDHDPLDALTAYIEDHGRDAVMPIHGVNQADTTKIMEVLDQQFGDTPLDLVIDDASHLYKQTRRSFETIFPRLRPGGLFIIEDWAWSVSGETWKTKHFRRKPGLINLVVQLMAAVGSRHPAFSDIKVYSHSAVVTRGTAPYSRSPLNLDDFVRSRGSRIKPRL